MKTRVLSLRLSYSTIAYCYVLQEKAGRDPSGKPVGTIVSDTVDAIVEASRKLYGIEKIETPEHAESIIGQYIQKLPGFEAAPIVEEIQGRKENGKTNGALKEETRPKEPSTAKEPQLEERPAEAEQRKTSEAGSPVVATNEFVYVMCPVCQGTKTQAEMAGYACLQCTQYAAESVRAPLNVPDIVEQVAAAEEEKDDQALVEALTIEAIERKSPQAEPVKPRCPWLGVVALEESEVEKDELYLQAKDIDELMGLAVRVVYAIINKEEWTTDRAISLVKATYNDWKKWRERYGEQS